MVVGEKKEGEKRTKDKKRKRKREREREKKKKRKIKKETRAHAMCHVVQKKGGCNTTTGAQHLGAKERKTKNK